MIASSAVAAWTRGVMTALVAYDPSQPREEDGPTAGQWVSDDSDQSAAGGDAEAKRLYAQLLNMPPEQRDAFLAGLSDDQLKRVGAFASLSSETKGPLADIRNKAGEAMNSRGIAPSAAGLKSKGGKKASESKGGGSGSGGGKSGGGSKGGGGKKSSGGGGGGKSSGGGSKKAEPKKETEKKPAPKTTPPAQPPPPPTAVPIGREPVGGRDGLVGPGAPTTQPVGQGSRPRPRERRATDALTTPVPPRKTNRRRRKRPS